MQTLGFILLFPEFSSSPYMKVTFTYLTPWYLYFTLSPIFFVFRLNFNYHHPEYIFVHEKYNCVSANYSMTSSKLTFKIILWIFYYRRKNWRTEKEIIRTISSFLCCLYLQQKVSFSTCAVKSYQDDIFQRCFSLSLSLSNTHTHTLTLSSNISILFLVCCCCCFVSFKTVAHDWLSTMLSMTSEF